MAKQDGVQWFHSCILELWLEQGIGITLMTQQKVLRQVSMQDQAYAMLRQAIMAGEYTPGQTITIRTLASSLGTSAMPIRDALGRLATEGAVAITDNRGFIIAPMTEERLREISRIRMEVEGFAAEQAAANINRSELQKLAKISKIFDQAMSEGNLTKYLECNREFHFTIYRAAGMPVLMKIIEGLWLQNGPAIRALLTLETFQNYDASTHDSAVKALRTGDAAKARAEITRDIAQGAEEILDSDYFAKQKVDPS